MAQTYLLSPTNGASNVGSDNGNGTTTLQLQWYMYPPGPPPLWDLYLNGSFYATYDSGVSLGYTATLTLVSGTNYTWYVNNSAVWSFTTAGTPSPSTPTLEYPTNELANVYLNKDWSMQFLWDDVDWDEGKTQLSNYTLWFYDPYIGWLEQTDRSRYSILGLSMWLGRTYEYYTTYHWFVRKTIDEVDYDSDIWSFTTIPLKPPVYTTREKQVYGGAPGETETIPSGENNLLTVKRLVVAAQNKIFYEDV